MYHLIILNQFGIAILAGLLNNLGDTYLTCSEYACDIRKNTWSVSYLQTEEETGISILNIFHWKFFVAGADMKIRMFFNDMSCNCKSPVTALAVGRLPAPRP